MGWDLLATILAGVAGGTKTSWRRLIAIEPLQAWQHVRFNWRLLRSGNAKEQRALDQAMDVVRAEHPYIVH